VFVRRQISAGPWPEPGASVDGPRSS